MDTYTANIICKNCTRQTHVEINKGTTVETWCRLNECDNCGCKELERADWY